MSDRSTEAKVGEAESAALALANLPAADRNAALRSIAETIEANADRILEANERDVAAAEELLDAGEYSQALVALGSHPRKQTRASPRWSEVSPSQDGPPLRPRNTCEARHLDDGLDLYQVTVPIGVIGTVFEVWPDALVQILAAPA
ncbi:MAG: hypothetical protein U5K37_12190 [Natrialbaceae archaeon]|nr:hypothetical protein [Natrialbaceae archaeon]